LASAAKSLSARLFAARLDLARALDGKIGGASGFSVGEQEGYDSGSSDNEPPTEDDVRADALKTLQDIVGGMSLDNFIVRRRRRVVEKYGKPEAWAKLDDEAREELVEEVAPLSATGLGTEEAKRFDLLMLSLELALLKGSKRFDKLKKQLIEIASAAFRQSPIRPRQPKTFRPSRGGKA